MVTVGAGVQPSSPHDPPEPLSAPTRRWRRPWRRQPRSTVAPLALAGLAFAASAVVVLADREATYQVARLVEDVPPGAEVDAGSWEYVELRGDGDAIDGLVSAQEAREVEGLVAARTLHADELLAESALRPASAPSALRAMSVPVAAERAVAGALSAGDRVDVLATVDGDTGYVAVDLEVLDVAGQGGLGRRTGTFTVTVAVDDETSVELARALEEGSLDVVRATGADDADAGLRYDADEAEADEEG